MVKAGAKMYNVFYIFLYLPSNATIADVVIHHFDLHFQGRSFSCYALALNIVQWQRISPLKICLDSHDSGRGVALVVQDKVNGFDLRIYFPNVSLQLYLESRFLIFYTRDLSIIIKTFAFPHSWYCKLGMNTPQIPQRAHLLLSVTDQLGLSDC